MLIFLIQALEIMGSKRKAESEGEEDGPEAVAAKPKHTGKSSKAKKAADNEGKDDPSRF